MGEPVMVKVRPNNNLPSQKNSLKKELRLLLLAELIAQLSQEEQEKIIAEIESILSER